MHSGKTVRIFSRMTKAAWRRWVVHVVEMTIKYTFAMIVMSVGCVAAALAISEVLKWMGVG